MPASPLGGYFNALSTPVSNVPDLQMLAPSFQGREKLLAHLFIRRDTTSTVDWSAIFTDSPHFLEKKSPVFASNVLNNKVTDSLNGHPGCHRPSKKLCSPDLCLSLSWKCLLLPLLTQRRPSQLRYPPAVWPLPDLSTRTEHVLLHAPLASGHCAVVGATPPSLSRGTPPTAEASWFYLSLCF